MLLINYFLVTCKLKKKKNCHRHARAIGAALKNIPSVCFLIMELAEHLEEEGIYAGAKQRNYHQRDDKLSSKKIKNQEKIIIV